MRLAKRLFASRKQQGMTLLEILISLSIGAFLLGGIIQIFIGAKQTYRFQEALSRLQENGRFAMEFIGKDIRKADYRACPTAPFVTNGANGSGSRDGVTGTNGTVNSTNPALDAADSIAMHWTLASCGGTTGGQTSGYSISSANLMNSSGTATQIEGVENMQVLYGIDTNSDGAPNYYIPATNDAAIMANAVTVRVSLLLRSIDDNIAAQPLAYTYNGGTATATDRRIRRVFTSTFALRNRIP